MKAPGEGPHAPLRDGQRPGAGHPAAFLADEPVSARPPSAGYQFRKFARRNKAALRGGGRHRRRAGGRDRRQHLAGGARHAARSCRDARASRRRARREGAGAQDAEAISKFLTEVFQSPDPTRDGRTITVAETLDKAAKKLDTDLATQPARRAQAAGHARQHLLRPRPLPRGHPAAGEGAGLLPRHLRPGAPRHAQGDEQPGDFLLRRRPPGRGAQAAGGGADAPPQGARPGAPRHARGDEQPGDFLRRRRPPGRGAQAAGGGAGAPPQGERPGAPRHARGDEQPGDFLLPTPAAGTRRSSCRRRCWRSAARCSARSTPTRSWR